MLRARVGLRFMLPLFCASLAWGQANFGTVVGTILDSSGGAIAGAKITVTNEGTNTVRTTETDLAGQYEVPSLIPGTYTVQVSATGFAPKKTNGIVINVQARQSVDFTLAVGLVTQQVEVTATPPLLQTQSADVGGVINSKQIEDLPLNGRRYSDLALLQAGVSKNLNASNAAVIPDRFNVDGNLDLQNNFLLDGTDNNSNSENILEESVQAVHPPPDALSEFRIQTRTYSAEFGMAAGAVINASIKSGTNQIHGDLWDFLRNDGLDANTFFNKHNGVPRGKFQQNQFGGTLGGPIRRDRSFFFGDFQGLISSTDTTTLSTVPTPLMKTGNFTEIFGTTTNRIMPVVPSQANCIPSPNVIASSCIDPVAKTLFNLYPSPNVPTAVKAQGTPNSFTPNNYQFVYSLPNHTYSMDSRFDQVINAANQIFARYSYEQQNYIAIPPWTSNPDVGSSSNSTQYYIRDQSVALGWTYTISPAVVNQFHAGFNRINAVQTQPGLTLGVSNAAKYGLTGIPPGPYDEGLPPISISGFTGLGSTVFHPQRQVSQVWQYTDSVSVLRGAHSLQFGYEYHRAGDTFLDTNSPQGSMAATGIYTFAQPVYGAPDFLLGDMARAAYTTPRFSYNYYPGSGYYAQDTWRVNGKLTLNYGLRYEYFSPMLSRFNRLANFSPQNGGELLPVAANESGAFARSTIHPDFRNFAPRLGFAYSMSKRLVWRGGYGVFYQHRDRIGSESMLSLNPPFVFDATYSQGRGSTTPVFQLTSGFPVGLFGNTVNLTTQRIRAQDPNQRTPYVEQASFGPQFLVTPDTALDVTYVGNWGRKMVRLGNANQGTVIGYDANNNNAPIVQFPYANLNSIVTSDNGLGQHNYLELATNDGNTDYSALQVDLKRQPKGGLGYGLDYTWSHTLADYVDILTAGGSGATPQNVYNKRPEMSNAAFNVGQRFVGNVVWDVPVGRNRKYLSHGNLLMDMLVGGWVTSTIVTIQSGLPFTVSAPDESFTGPNHQSRPNCVGNPYAGATTNLYTLATAPLGDTSVFFMNPAAFALPAAGTFGNCRPRDLTGPGLKNVDFSLFKVFPIHEQQRVEFRAEFFNTFNHANFGAPLSSFSQPLPAGFGHITSTVTGPRIIQLALKFYF